MRYLYATVKSLRDLGIVSAQMDEHEAVRNLTRYSTRINEITGKVFAPTARKFQVFGDGKRVKIQGSPFVKVGSIKLINSDGSRTLIDPSLYEVYGKHLSFYYQVSDEPYTLEIEGVFGNLERLKEIPVTLTGAIDGNSASVTVQSAADLEAFDVLVFKERCFLISKVDYGTNTVYFDRQQDSPLIPVGSTTVCYGGVPQSVFDVAGLFIQHKGTLERGTFIKSETIGKYRYELFDGALGGITGVNAIDMILAGLIDDPEIELFYL